MGQHDRHHHHLYAGAIAGAYFHDFVMKPAYKEEELPVPTRAEAQAD